MASQKSEFSRVKLNQFDCAVHCLVAGHQLHRLFRHAGSDFKPAPPLRRNGRLDPPKDSCHEFGVLYTSNSLLTAALESKAVLLLPTSPPEYALSEFNPVGQLPLQVATLSPNRSVRFIDLADEHTAAAFGVNLNSLLDELGSWRRASYAIFNELRNYPNLADVVGICYRSRYDKSELNFAMFEGRFETFFVSKCGGTYKPDLPLG